jgi:hypothetical protein
MLLTVFEFNQAMLVANFLGGQAKSKLFKHTLFMPGFELQPYGVIFDALFLKINVTPCRILTILAMFLTDFEFKQAALVANFIGGQTTSKLFKLTLFYVLVITETQMCQLECLGPIECSAECSLYKKCFFTRFELNQAI